MRRRQLISKYQLSQNQMLHNAARSFGASSYKWGERVREIIKENNISSVLDYGCGEGGLRKKVRPKSLMCYWRNYDPAIERVKKIPNEPFDLIVCTDVLEHIEIVKLGNVLQHIFSMAQKMVFFVIALNPANKTLPDGRNTHLILEKSDWWITRIKTKTNWSIKIGSTPRKDKDLVLEVRNVNHNKPVL